MIRKRDKGRFWLRVSMVIIAAVALAAGYFLGLEQGRQESEKPAVGKAKKEGPPQPQKEEAKAKESPVVSGEIKQIKPVDPKEYCARIEDDVQEFFKYLNKRSYIKHLDEGLDTSVEFKRLLGKLSSNLPVPAGEGIDPTILRKNIFQFFRVLNRTDIRLIKDIIANESETLELNLELFYRWLTLGDRCPDPEGIRPSFDTLYHYAGFFLDTIGGRAYVSRRPQGLRLLLSYYSLLIIHDADLRGKNTYGIDAFPYIAPLAAEINLYPHFKLKKEYLQQMNQWESYYLQKR